MKITPLAAESMGTRSMATFVETKDCRVLIDPGANVGAFRYGFPPHPLERWCLQKHRERIQIFAQSADVVIITHYHFDHFIPDAPNLYQDKTLLLKNPNQRINVNQRNRAFKFLKLIRGLPKEVSYIDGRAWCFGETRIVFSDPVPHGATEKMGFVVQVALQDERETFLYSSDIQGPCREDPVDFILSQNPEFLYLDGPVTYLQGDSSEKEPLEKTLERMEMIIDKTKVIKVIVDHHLLRDLQWKENIEPLYAVTHQHGVLIQTAAEFRGEENNLLEARRKQLYEDDLPEKTRGQDGHKQ